MKYRKVEIERIIVEESTQKERLSLINDGYVYSGDNYCGYEIFEKTISNEGR